MVYADEVAKGYFGHTMLQVDDVTRQVVISFLQTMKTLTLADSFVSESNAVAVTKGAEVKVFVNVYVAVSVSVNVILVDSITLLPVSAVFCGFRLIYLYIFLNLL